MKPTVKWVIAWAVWALILALVPPEPAGSQDIVISGGAQKNKDCIPVQGVPGACVPVEKVSPETFSGQSGAETLTPLDLSQVRPAARAPALRSKEPSVIEKRFIKPLPSDCPPPQKDQGGVQPEAPGRGEYSAAERAGQAPTLISQGRCVPQYLTQFGYDLFGVAPSTFAPVSDVPVGDDYVIGPGDSLILFIWGFAEGTTKSVVDREGKITLPKIGPVFVWGSTFGQAKKIISDAYARQYSGVRVNVTMGRLRTIKVYVLGDVLQAGAYEVSALATATNALMTAGGPTKLGSLRRIRLLRSNATVGEIDLYKFLLAGDRSQDYRLESGDTLFVPPIGPVAGISGDVKRPAIYELKEAIRLQELIDFAGGLTPLGYLERIQIERIEEHQKKIVLDASMTPGQASIRDNPVLQDADFVSVFGIYDRVTNSVTLRGAIRQPGNYELKPGMRVKDLLDAGGLLPETDPDSGELVRVLEGTFERTVILFAVKDVVAGRDDANIDLHRGDEVTVMSLLRPAVTVTVGGEVRFPGTYVVRKGERISSIIRRAGGLTDRAFLPGAVFTRQMVKKYEEEQIQKFIQAKERVITAEAAQPVPEGVSKEEAGKSEQALSERRALLQKVAASVALGRLVVHLSPPDALDGTRHDLVLEDGDMLTIPQSPSSVQVLGSVNNPTAFAYEPGNDVRTYVAMAGGMSPEADKKAVYIIRADGSAVASYVRAQRVELGDAIIVPPSTKAEYPKLPFWRDIITILGQTALTAAALATIF